MMVPMNDRDKDHFPSQCDLCSYNTRNPHLPCAVHPAKIVDAQCPDFVPDPSLPAGEWWEPEGALYYGGELVIDPVQRWTREQKLALLDWHPMFTGRCPQCELPMTQTTPVRVHWDCQECEWKDDSV